MTAGIADNKASSVTTPYAVATSKPFSVPSVHALRQRVK
jgi:hypothetical protein